MTELNQIYKCNVCGNIVELVHSGAGKMACCDQPMQHKAANTEEASTEKHVPHVEITSEGLRVSVGSVAHPMEDKHYIEWIEMLSEDRVIRKHLKPGDTPEAKFHVKDKAVVRAYCNLHGLWIKEI